MLSVNQSPRPQDKCMCSFHVVNTLYLVNTKTLVECIKRDQQGRLCQLQ